MDPANCLWRVLCSNAGLCPAAGLYTYFFLTILGTETCTFPLIYPKTDLLASWTHWNVTLLLPLPGYWRERYWGRGIYCIAYWVPASLSYDPVILGSQIPYIIPFWFWLYGMCIWSSGLVLWLFLIWTNKCKSPSLPFLRIQKKDDKKNWLGLGQYYSTSRVYAVCFQTLACLCTAIARLKSYSLGL